MALAPGRKILYCFTPVRHHGEIQKLPGVVLKVTARRVVIRLEGHAHPRVVLPTSILELPEEKP